MNTKLLIKKQLIYLRTEKFAQQKTVNYTNSFRARPSKKQT